jgi:N-acetyl-anhydromuramyl-L-alanine amidase AmpD
MQREFEPVLTPRANREIKHIVVHHSATDPEHWVDAAEIHAWHRHRGWAGIGYHYCVLTDGTVEQGRPEYWVGAHANWHNDTSIGVCIVGTGLPTTKAQLRNTQTLLRKLLERYPDAQIVGHRELRESTRCPGFDISELGIDQERRYGTE